MLRVAASDKVYSYSLVLPKKSGYCAVCTKTIKILEYYYTIERKQTSEKERRYQNEQEDRGTSS